MQLKTCETQIYFKASYSKNTCRFELSIQKGLFVNNLVGFEQVLGLSAFFFLRKFYTKLIENILKVAFQRILGF